MAIERLQKILARAGVASRRAAETMIVDGRVRVNGRVVRELGAKADPQRDKVEFDGTRLVAETFVYVVLHKPRGVVATMSDPEGRPTVRDLLQGVAGRVYPVGRLDFATSGVLLATNDGDFAEALMHPRRDVPKTYVLKVSGVMTDDDLETWRTGVELEDGKTLPARVMLLRHEGDKTWIELTIREGRNQQIRRMGEATGYPVMRLARTSFAGITSEGLRPGAWRSLTRDELETLKKGYGVPKRLPHVDEGGGIQGHVQGRVQGRGRPPPRSPRPTKKPEPRAEGGARYGGGAPGRRSHDVRTDWGGGASRGKTEGHDEASTSNDFGGARGDLGRGGGRGERTRTTGTGGGVRGSSDGSYRISRTRRG